MTPFLTRWHSLRNRWVVFAHDLAWVPATVFIAYWLRFNLDGIPSQYLEGAWLLALLAIPVHAVTLWIFGCYRGIWLFASIPDLIRIAKAVGLAGLITGAAAFLIGRLEGVPRSVLVLYPILLAGILASARMAYRVLKDRGLRGSSKQVPRALVVGAGRAGELLVRDILRFNAYVPVGFVDDDVSKLGHEIHGVRVRGSLEDLPTLIRAFHIEVVLLAIPSAPRETVDRVVEITAETGVVCRTLPSLVEMANGRITVSGLRPVTVRDLLGRKTVSLDDEAIGSYLEGRRVVVTGGGGSIGLELCRQIAEYNPACLVVMELSEYGLFKVEQELRMKYPELKLELLLLDIKDRRAVNQIFREISPQTVFHAAAFKHVPLVEQNPIDGIANNVLGTQVVAEAADAAGVETFVLISTDKTVQPSNVMGATKRVAELYCQYLDQRSQTHFIVTRFGNVLGSAGSVVPLFEKQIARGGPVTVTHPEVSRYFMTISEAVGLILQAGAMGHGGEIYVLDMGEPVRIQDLAEKMIKLSGFRPGADMQIVFTGLRPGEKLHESLFYDHEALHGTAHPQLLLAEGSCPGAEDLPGRMEELGEAVRRRDVGGGLDLLRAIVPEYQQLPAPEDTTSRPGVVRLVK